MPPTRRGKVKCHIDMEEVGTVKMGVGDRRGGLHRERPREPGSVPAAGHKLASSLLTGNAKGK